MRRYTVLSVTLENVQRGFRATAVLSVPSRLQCTDLSIKSEAFSARSRIAALVMLYVAVRRDVRLIQSQPGDFSILPSCFYPGVWRG
jgi:hypothetical protein